MRHKQQLRINDALYHIHKDIAAPLSASEVAKKAAYSEQHFHRVFKQTVGETFNNYVRRTRLEHAANQLMFDHQSNILTLIEKCGFCSQSSFNQIFKRQFGVTPGEWRQQDEVPPGTPYLADPDIQLGYKRIQGQKLSEPDVRELDEQRVAYVRHTGYGRSIRNAWLVLRAWALEEGCYNGAQQIGLHHSNPAWVALEKCRYVACMTISKPLRRRGSVNQLVIPGGLHAIFQLQGQYGELLPWLGHILEQWLPSSGFKLQTTPVLARYKKNHFLSDDGRFDVELCLPVSVM